VEKEAFQIYPVGRVRKSEGSAVIDIDPEFADALLGLEGFSHINVLFWFHLNDSPEKRRILRTHPRRDPRNPLTGVFATHSPIRPNLIGVTLCRLLSVRGTTLRIEAIDAEDDTPVIDIKGFIPRTFSEGEVRLPAWV